jgi:hypothetical protein
MKHLLLSCLFLGIGTCLSQAAPEFRTFTSADKKATLSAFAESFSKAKDGKPVANLKLANGTTRAVAFDLLSAEDQEFLRKEMDLFLISRSVQAEVKPVNSKPQEVPQGDRKVTTAENAFGVKLFNGSDTALKDVTVNYRIVYRKASWDEKKNEQKERQVQAGSFSVGSLEPRKPVEEKTSGVVMTSNKYDPAKGCKT